MFTAKETLAASMIFFMVLNHANLLKKQQVGRVKLQNKNIHGIELSIQRLYEHAKTINFFLSALRTERFVPLAPGQVSSPSAKERE